MQASKCSVPAHTQIHPSEYSQSFRWSPCRTSRLDVASVQPDTGLALLFGLLSRPLDRVFGLRSLRVFHRPNTGFSQTQRPKG